MRTWVITTLFFAAGVAFGPAVALAEAPPLLPVQGFLADADGVPIDGTVVLQISLYETEAAAEALFTEPRSVDVDEGFFSVYAGEVTMLDLDLMRDMQSLWLGIAVNNEPELTPRVQIATAPFSAYATYCGEATTLEGAIATDFATAGHAHEWTEITDVPADLADGDADALGALACAADQVAKMGATGWTCATLSVDFDAIQARVSGTCTAGSSIRAISSNGTVTCETDDVGAAVNHVHSASAITSGTLSTARYDAYGDLTAAGRLDNNSGTDVLTRTQLDSRYANTTGQTFTGNVRTSGWFEYSPAKSIVEMMGPNQFRNISEADDTWHYLWNWGSGYISSGSSPYTVDLFATIDAPNEAVVRSIRCFYRDNHISADISNMTFRLIGQSGGFAPTIYATSAAVSTTGRNATIRSQTLSTSRTMTTARDWHIHVGWTQSALGNFSDGPAFYGCELTYDLTRLRP